MGCIQLGAARLANARNGLLLEINQLQEYIFSAGEKLDVISRDLRWQRLPQSCADSGPAMRVESRGVATEWPSRRLTGCSRRARGQRPAAGSDARATAVVLYHGSCAAAPRW